MPLIWHVFDVSAQFFTQEMPDLVGDGVVFAAFRVAIEVLDKLIQRVTKDRFVLGEFIVGFVEEERRRRG